MQTKYSFLFLLLIVMACSSNKNIAQTKRMQTGKDTLLEHINNSQKDTEIINPMMAKLQEENELVISLATLNYAWAKRGTYYVLASNNKQWKLYRYESKLPATANMNIELSPVVVEATTAEKIKQLYSAAALWKTTGIINGNNCTGRKTCNINDAETWAMSIATQQSVHTTTYYAPEFFEECCPGNEDRKQFVAIAKEIMKLAGGNNFAPEK